MVSIPYGDGLYTVSIGYGDPLFALFKTLCRISCDKGLFYYATPPQPKEIQILK